MGVGNEQGGIKQTTEGFRPVLKVRETLKLSMEEQFLKYYIAVLRIMLPIMHNLFLVLRPNNGKTNRELLFEREGYSMKKYKRVFHVNERKKLDKNESSEKFDIVILFKLLHLTCGLDDFSSPSWDKHGTLENTLLRMKNHRNILFRENDEVPFSVMEARFKEIEELCHRVLIIIGLKTKRCMTADIAEMKNSMSVLLYGDVD